MSEYRTRYNGALPPVLPLMDAGLNETALHRRALLNNHQFVYALMHQQGLAREDLADLPVTSLRRSRAAGASGGREEGGAQVVATEDVEMELHDAWGGPVVFMTHQHPSIGMAPGDRPFFFSAGPDGRYLSREDNLYSYESGQELPSLPAQPPSGTSLPRPATARAP
jgi:hypothetical protein